MGKKVAIGIGNYFQQDDGIGPRVIEEIGLRNLNIGFDIEDIATDGLKLFKHFTPETEKIVIIDSAYMGQKPGTIMLFSPHAVSSHKTMTKISSHEGDVLNLINLGKKLNLTIPEIKILAIEPDQVGEGNILSSRLEKKIDKLIELVMEEMT